VSAKDSSVNAPGRPKGGPVPEHVSAKGHPGGIPLPTVTRVTAPFWEACRRGVLQVQQCRHCGYATFPADVACNRCLSADLNWSVCKGTGVVKSFSIVRRPAQPAFDVPYIAAIVELDEGWCLFTNLVRCAVENVSIGMRVRAEFVTMSPEITLPYFAPSPAI